MISLFGGMVSVCNFYFLRQEIFLPFPTKCQILRCKENNIINCKFKTQWKRQVNAASHNVIKNIDLSYLSCIFIMCIYIWLCAELYVSD
jgi:hypothetical protein